MLPVEGFTVGVAYAVLTSLYEDVLVFVEGLAGYLVYTFRSVVPVDGICDYVVGARLAASLRALLLGGLRGILATTGGNAK